MKNFFPYRVCCFLFFALAPCCGLQAQTISPWFRGTQQTWKIMTENSFSAARAAQTPFIRPLSGLHTGYAVKTTVPNWLAYRLSHSNTFSAMEKNIFKIHPNNLSAVTGKLTYFWDRDALLAASAGPGEVNEKAFGRHQELLQHTLAEVEQFAREEIAKQFNSSLFSTEEINHLLADPSQPQAFILSRKEIETFPTLSLEEQKTFAQNAWQNAVRMQTQLLATNPQTLTTQRFSDYYYLKLRRSYFSLLANVLERASVPRRTIIIRVKKRLPFDFLPEANLPLTDAQRLGKLYFYTEHFQMRGPEGLEKSVALKAEAERQRQLYEPYALAEAFGVPYENALKRGLPPTDILFGAEEAARLRMLTSRQAVDELPEKISALQTAQRQAHPKDEPLDFYVHYFRLHAQEQYLQLRLAQARFFLQYLP